MEAKGSFQPGYGRRGDERCGFKRDLSGALTSESRARLSGRYRGYCLGRLKRQVVVMDGTTLSLTGVIYGLLLHETMELPGGATGRFAYPFRDVSVPG